VHLTAPQIADLDTIAAFLAQDDLGALDAAALARSTGSPAADALVLLGSSVLHTAERACAALRAGLAPRLVIAGGIGHSTGFLRDALAAHPRYRDALGPDLPEAELLARVAVRHLGVDPAQLVLETASTNCGDNAVRTRAELARRGLAPRSLVLLQDPTMQRRTGASFARAFADAPEVQLVNHAVFTPGLEGEGAAVHLAGPPRAGLWPVDRFVSLVMGEVPRLRDDAAGYGPRGRGFIAHVDVPPEVEAAHGRLAAVLGGGGRGRAPGGRSP
jgi:uncharacterized SAM-binding protein YcdF (DUF218 family)